MTRRRDAMSVATAVPIDSTAVPNALAWLQVWVIGAVAAVLMVMMGGVHPGPRALAGRRLRGCSF
ncbi:MAG: hypothetical protein KFB96_05790 [Thiocapsa sp.]|uniref:hypothetical protein n=1 Tax=Thiocapsa sp. TaxID=2024551 RepID=UPI001BCC2EA0|nr:hypothetical protein [Thiocapsa sp.]QVL49988.1 MAG: hypothetical protein KFB96_05790 [Thiocapsa sp.]